MRTSTVLVVLFIASLWGYRDAYALGWVLAEKYEVTTGEFRGFVIGSTKQVAAQTLRNLGGRDLTAIPLPPDLAATTRDSSEVMELVRSRNGIRIVDMQGLDFRLFFADQQIVEIDNHSTTTNSQQVFQKGQTREVVGAKLGNLLREHPRVQVESVSRIDSAYWGMVNRDVKSAVAILAGYDGWQFIVPSEKPGGAIYRLFFIKDRLVRLQYERPRFRE